jgi:hypothetical protein
MRCSSGWTSSSIWKRLTPTTTCSPRRCPWPARRRPARSRTSGSPPRSPRPRRPSRRCARCRPAPRLDLVGQRLDEVAAGERVDRGRHVGLVRDHLLGPQRQAGRLLGRQRERLVEELVCSDWVPPSAAASAWIVTRTRFTSGCWAVSCTPAVWVWKRSIWRLRVLRAEAVAHDRRPQPPGGPELRDLLEQRRAGHEEEAQPRRERVDVEPGVERRLDVGDAVGEREGDLLHRRRPGLTHVVAGDRDGVEARQPVGAVGEGVGDDPQARRRRVDVGAAGDVLLEHVVLDRAAQLRRVDALLLGRRSRTSAAAGSRAR